MFYEVSQGSGDSSVGDDSVDPEKTLEQRRSRAARNSKKFGTLLRSKGWFWIGNRPIGIGEWSQAGVIGRLGCNAQWRITAPEEYWPEQGTPERAKFVEDFPDDEKDEVRGSASDIGRVDGVFMRPRRRDAIETAA